MSAICTFAMVGLGFSEIKSYLEPSTSSNIFTGTSHRADVFHANIDITFPYIPCDVIGLDIVDSLENYQSDYYGELHKHRLDADGNDVGIESWYEKNVVWTELRDRARKEFEAKQGCRFEGYVELNRVPGNFYIWSSNWQDILYQMEAEGHHLDYSYKINHVSFGKK